MHSPLLWCLAEAPRKPQPFTNCLHNTIAHQTQVLGYEVEGLRSQGLQDANQALHQAGQLCLDGTGCLDPRTCQTVEDIERGATHAHWVNGIQA